MGKCSTGDALSTHLAAERMCQQERSLQLHRVGNFPDQRTQNPPIGWTPDPVGDLQLEHASLSTVEQQRCAECAGARMATWRPVRVLPGKSTRITLTPALSSSPPTYRKSKALPGHPCWEERAL